MANLNLKTFEDIVKKLKSEDTLQEDKQLAMNNLRKLYSKNDPTDDQFNMKSTQQCNWMREIGICHGVSFAVSEIIVQVCKSGVDIEDVGYMTDAFWILSNISTYNLSTLNLQAVSCAANIINNCNYTELVMQCIRLAANADSNDDQHVVHKIKEEQIYPKLVSMFPKVGHRCKHQIIYFYLCLSLSDCILSDSQLLPMMTHASSVLKPDCSADLALLAIRLLDEMTLCGRYNDFELDKTQHIPQVTALISHADLDVRNQCILGIASVFLRGTDQLILPVMKSNIMAQLLYVLHCENNHVCTRHALWLLTKFVSGSDPVLFKCFFQYDFLPLIQNYVNWKNTEIASEAIWLLDALCDDALIQNVKKHFLQLKNLESVFETVVNCIANDSEPSESLSFFSCFETFKKSKIDACFQRLKRRVCDDRYLLSVSRKFLAIK